MLEVYCISFHFNSFQFLLSKLLTVVIFAHLTTATTASQSCTRLFTVLYFHPQCTSSVSVLPLIL